MRRVGSVWAPLSEKDGVADGASPLFDMTTISVLRVGSRGTSVLGIDCLHYKDSTHYCGMIQSRPSTPKGLLKQILLRDTIPVTGRCV